MNYVSSGTVEASDYNTLAALINDVFGTGTGDSGYGGNSTNTGVTDLPTIAQGEVIQSATGAPGSPDEWINLRNAFDDCATHQGTVLSDTLPSDTLLEDGDIVTFFNNLQSATNSTDLTTNRLNVGVVHSVATKLTSVRGTSWTSNILHEFSVTFADSDAARHYFNTGGEIRISATRTGGSSNPQNTAWTDLVNANSPYIFTGTEYFALGLSFALQRSVISGTPYAANAWDIRAKTNAIGTPNGGNGSVLTFRSNFLDGHSNIFFDTVDGTFTSTIEEKRSIVVFPQTSPTFTTITGLSSGS